MILNTSKNFISVKFAQVCIRHGKKCKKDAVWEKVNRLDRKKKTFSCGFIVCEKK